jgi:hypothetical protein
MNLHVRSSSRDLSAGQILRQCKYGIPVNTCVEAAIKAHGIAFDYYLSNRGDPDALYRTMQTLRAVVLARIPGITDCRRQIDYLTKLPSEAWALWPAGDPNKARDTTLSAIARSVIWKMET